MAILYLGPDDEITGIIERIRDTEDENLSLVAPKGTALLQSMINIRLLRKKADELGKHLSLVSNDPVTRNLAAQSNIDLYERIEDVPDRTKSAPVHAPAVPKEPEIEHKEESKPQHREHEAGIRVSRYDDKKTETDKPQPKSVAASSAVVEAAQASAISPEAPTEPAGELAEPPVQEQSTPEEKPQMREADDVIVGHHVATEHRAQHHAKKAVSHVQRPRKSLPHWLVPVVLLVIIIVLGSGMVAAAVVPSSTVVIHVPTEELKKTVTVSVDAKGGTGESTIAGTIREATAEASAEAKATGVHQIGDKAKGTITVSNLYSTNAITIGKNTTFTAKDKKLQFKSLSDVTVPGETITKVNGSFVETPGKADVAVEASEGGDGYNIGPSTFSIDGQSALVTGSNAKAMAGGTTKTEAVVTTADIEQAKKDATSKIQDATKNAFTSSTDEIVISETQKIDVTLGDPNHKSGDVAGSVSVNGSGKGSVLVYNRAALNEIVPKLLAGDVPDEKTLILPDLSTVSWTVRKTGDNINLEAEIVGQLAAKIDQSTIKSSIKGKKPAAAIADLTDTYKARSVEITQNPAKWPILPFLASRITVTITE